MPDPVANMEAAKCIHCKLVQFVTARYECRRCKAPLDSISPPSPMPTLVIARRVPRAAGNTVETLGQCVVRERNRAHLSQRDVARRMGTSRQYLSKVENGRLTPEAAQVVRIASAIGCHIGDLCPALKGYSTATERDLLEIRQYIPLLDERARAAVLHAARDMFLGYKRGERILRFNVAK